MKSLVHNNVELLDGNYRKIKILYEDEWLAVIFKPSGLLSVPVTENGHGRNAAYLLESIMRRSGKYSAGHKPFAVHRLDRDTSGVMMFALNKNVQKKVMDSWQEMVTVRLYRAVAENPRGKTLPESGVINSPLAFNAYNIAYVPSDKQLQKGRIEKTVSAVTNYRIIECGEKYSLFELNLDTGRKNQIRAHLASKGYPLAGDVNYRAKTNPFGRLALHARTLEFTHPFTGKKMKFEVPEPEEWHRKLSAGKQSFEKNKNLNDRAGNKNRTFKSNH